MHDVAQVVLGSQQYNQSCTLDGEPSVALSIFQLPGINALSTANGVYSKMHELKARFPEDVEFRIVYDTTPFIRESVNEVFSTLRDAIILVAIVVVENVERWLDEGAEPREAARKAMGEVTDPVVAMALVLCAVFVPCMFLGGITGQSLNL